MRSMKNPTLIQGFNSDYYGSSASSFALFSILSALSCRLGSEQSATNILDLADRDHKYSRNLAVGLVEQGTCEWGACVGDLREARFFSSAKDGNLIRRMGA